MVVLVKRINKMLNMLLIPELCPIYLDYLSFLFNEYSIPLVWNNQFHYSGASEYNCSGTNLYADQELTCIGKLPSSNKCSDVEGLGFTPGNSLLAGVDMMNVSFFILDFK